MKKVLAAVSIALFVPQVHSGEMIQMMLYEDECMFAEFGYMAKSNPVMWRMDKELVAQQKKFNGQNSDCKITIPEAEYRKEFRFCVLSQISVTGTAMTKFECGITKYEHSRLGDVYEASLERMVNTTYSFTEASCMFLCEKTE